jgi:hypothetical protein
MVDNNDKIDDAESMANTIKPAPTFSQRPTPLIPAQPIKSIVPTRRRNWDILTSISFVILLIIAVALYIFVNHPFRHSQKNVLIRNINPVLITAPIESIEPSFIPEQKIEPINPPSSSSANNQIIPPHKKIKLIKDDKEKDYGI